MKKTHTPLLGIVLSFILGITIAHKGNIGFFYVMMAAFLLMGVVLGFNRKAGIATWALCAAFLFLGAGYTQSYQTSGASDIGRVARFYRKKPIAVQGVVVSDIQRSSFLGHPKISFVLKVKAVQAPWGWQKRKGLVLVNIYREIDNGYGDEILLEGRLHRPFSFQANDNFSYAQYLEYRGIHYILSIKKNGTLRLLKKSQADFLRMFLFSLRHRGQAILERYLSVPEGGIMQAIILGERSQIPQHVRELFVRTGTAHVLAISGLHIGIITAILLVILRILPVGRKSQYALTIVLLILYALLTGTRPSVVRATVMAVVFLASLMLEEETQLLNTLSCAAMVILVVNPLSLFDVGFQLSFICVLSIILIHPPIAQWRRRHWPEWKGVWLWYFQAVSISLAAWIGIAGVMAYYFNIVTPIAVVLNIFIIPLLTVLLVLGFGLLLTAIFVPAVAGFFAICLKIVLNALVMGIFLCAQIPWGHFYVENITLLFVTIYYVFWGGLILVLWHFRRVLDRAVPLKTSFQLVSGNN